MADFRFSKAGLPTRTVASLTDDDLLKISNDGFTTDETIKAKDLLQTQSYNSATRELTLTNGNTVVLTGLDVPDYTLTGLYASKYSDNAIQISTGQVKTSTGQVIKLDSTLIKNTANWGSGGGLDTGTVEAGALYYIFVIYNPTTLESNAVFSLSSTSPTLPSGYTEAFLIGTFRMFSHIDAIEFVQNWVRYYSFGVNDIALNYNYVSNYDYTHVKTSTPNTLSIGNLSARDYYITTNIVMTSMSKKIQAPFSEGLDGNLLDATLIADTDYILYAICKENGAYPDIILIEKPAVITSPTLPSGFTNFAIIGYGRTNASSELLIWKLTEDWVDANDRISNLAKSSSSLPDAPLFEDLYGTGVKVATFPGTGTTRVDSGFEYPHGAKENYYIQPHFHWAAEDTGTGDAVFYVKYIISNIGGAIASESFERTVTISMPGNTQPQVAGFEWFKGTVLKPGTQIGFTFQRLADDPGNTYTGKVSIATFGSHILMENIGSNLIFDN